MSNMTNYKSVVADDQNLVLRNIMDSFKFVEGTTIYSDHYPEYEQPIANFESKAPFESF